MSTTLSSPATYLPPFLHSNRSYSVLSGIFQRSNKARATPTLVSFRDLIQTSNPPFHTGSLPLAYEQLGTLLLQPISNFGEVEMYNLYYLTWEWLEKRGVNFANKMLSVVNIQVYNKLFLYGTYLRGFNTILFKRIRNMCHRAMH